MLSVTEYFDGVAADYHRHYAADWLDMSMPYPANAIRRKMLFASFKDVKNPIDVGGGDGTILEHWNSGAGFDISPAMVKIARLKHGNRFIQADITRPGTYAPLLAYGPFDGLIAMGVMPHIEDTEQAIRNMQALVRGKVFIEFRNDLFNLFAMNRLTADFMGALTGSRAVTDELKRRLPDLPKERPYDQILSKFHNPFGVEDLFKRLGFTNIHILYYHYHPTLPWLERDNDVEFRKAALAMEGQPPTWKSMFQCSAFVVEARNE